MVLHHVAQRACPLVVWAPVLDADALGHRDLDVVDVRAVPERLEQRVGEAQRHQVLDGFLAEVMVDPEDLILVEDGADLVVDRAGRGEVVADRLLQHHSGLGRDQVICGQTTTDRPEQIGQGREIEHADTLWIVACGGKLDPAGRIGDVQPDVAQPAEKAREADPVEMFRGDVLAERGLGLGSVGLALELPAGHADDQAVRRQLAVQVPVVQRRQQLAPSQVAGAAEHHEIERADRDDLCRHGTLLTVPTGRAGSCPQVANLR